MDHRGDVMALHCNEAGKARICPGPRDRDINGR
jgi:hypothetical protein